MRHRIPPGLVLLLLAGICGAIILGVAALRRGKVSSQEDMLARLPTDGAVLLRVDFAALRNAGVLDVLAGAEMIQEPEYRAFVEQSGFDYARDLDSALIAFHPSGNYFVLNGRFHWPTLKEYVKRAGGLCYNLFCRVGGSTPERKISFFPLREEVMGLAVSQNESAAEALQDRRPVPAWQPPEAPVWSFVPASALGRAGSRAESAAGSAAGSRAGSLPADARPFVSALAGADTILLTLDRDGDRLSLRADVRCRSGRDAAQLTSELRDTTSRLREAMAKSGKVPDVGDVARVLILGEFEQKEMRVLGRWPVERSWLEALAGKAL